MEQKMGKFGFIIIIGLIGGAVGYFGTHIFVFALEFVIGDTPPIGFDDYVHRFAVVLGVVGAAGAIWGAIEESME